MSGEHLGRLKLMHANLEGRPGNTLKAEKRALAWALAALQAPCVGTSAQSEKVARWLCEFAKLDPREPISDGGHSAVDWIAHYDVPRLLALLSVQPVLDGEWVLVPKEPTEAIVKAIEFALYRYGDCTARNAERATPFLYRAMLSAVPSLPDSQTSGGGE
jgi:hypothetical protein